MSSEPEDWVGFKEKVEADPNVPNRSEVLAIIDSSDDPDRKEAKLRALGGGAAFRYVLKIFSLRYVARNIKIDYTVREFTVDEGREIIKTRPQQLSLGRCSRWLTAMRSVVTNIIMYLISLSVCFRMIR